jgi:hypothetical protein
MVFLPLAAGLGCATTNEVNPLIKRAMFDLDCPREQLSWQKIDNQTFGVRGCGQKATYIESCRGEGLSETCVWVRNH